MNPHLLGVGLLLCIYPNVIHHASAAGPVERHLGEIRILPTDSLLVGHGLDSVKSYGFETSVAIEGMRTAKELGRTSWWIDWLDADTVPYLRVAVRWGNGIPDEPSFDSAFLQVTVTALPSGETLASGRLSSGVSLARGANTLMADCNESGRLGIYVGDDNLREACSLSGVAAPDMIMLKANRPADVDYLAARFTPAPVLPVIPREEIDSVMAVQGAVDSSPVGIWSFLDRDTDGVRSQLGGYYTIAVIPHDGRCDNVPGVDAREEPAFDILYLEGAKVNPAAWAPGMLKGQLHPTPFIGHYRLVWYDALKEDMGRECFADLADNALLTLSFPLHGGKIRFSRVR